MIWRKKDRLPAAGCNFGALITSIYWKTTLGGPEMKRVGFITLLLTIVITGLFSWPHGKASACSCAGGDAQERLERASAVFVGKVIEKGGRKAFEFGQLREYTFQVDQAWKGVDAGRMTIYSYDGPEASCGYAFEKGQTYLVYSYENKDKSLQTNLCSGNIPISQAGDELRQLGAGVAVDPDSGAEPGGESRSFFASSYVLGFGAAALIVILAAIVIWRRKNKGGF